MKIEPTVALFKMLCGAKMAGVAWEGVEEHVLRSMRGGGSGGGDGGGEGGGESKGGDETKGAGTVVGGAGGGGGGDCVRELLGRLLEVDYYSNEVRGKVVEVFVGERGGRGGGGGAAMGGGGGGGLPSAVVRLLDEARWVSLQVGDKVKAWNGNNGKDTAYIAATVTKDNGNGTYAVKYEDPTQTNDGNPTWSACPESAIKDYKESDAAHRRNFRSRGKGTRAASLQGRLTVHDDDLAAAMVELLRWSREDMGGDTKRVKALVTITPDLALEGMRAAVKAAAVREEKEGGVTVCGSGWGGCWRWTITAMRCGGRWWRCLWEGGERREGGVQRWVVVGGGCRRRWCGCWTRRGGCRCRWGTR
jgi:hypothetical protein